MTYGLRPMRRPLMRDPRLLIDWIGGTPFPAGSYTRASDGATRGADGVWRQVAAGVPRTTWRRDASGLLLPATLLEPAATNAWTWSEDLTQAVWSKQAVTVAANATTAPDGTLTADKLVESATTANHEIRRGATVADNAVQAVSFFARPGERKRLRVYCQRKDGSYADGTGTIIDLETGAITQRPNQTVRLLDVGPDGWRRFEVAWNVGAGSTTQPQINLRLNIDAAADYPGDGTSGLYIWGLQFEADRAVASSYIRTTAAAAVRAADSLYLDLPEEIRTPGAALAIYSRYVMLHEPTLGFATSPAAWAISGASGAGPRLYHYQNSADGRLSLRHDVSPTSTPFQSVGLPSPKPTPGDVVEAFSLVWTDTLGRLVGDFSASVNRGPIAGAVLPPLAPAAEWSGVSGEPRRLYIGSRGVSPGVFEWERLRVWSGYIAGSDAARWAFARGEI